MPIARNPVMIRKGFAPAAEVARKLEKALSTIHHLVEDGKVVGERDGRMLYVSLDSLKKHYDGEDSPTLASIVATYRTELRREFA